MRGRCSVVNNWMSLLLCGLEPLLLYEVGSHNDSDNNDDDDDLFIDHV